MRAEKSILSEEVGRHLAKSDYVFLASYTKATVSDVTALRAKLKEQHAEFHVVKNSALKAAAKRASYPALDELLVGQLAIIVGGRDPSAVAKVVREFFKSTQKVEVKGGVLSKKALAAGDVEQLADLPPLPNLRAQLMGLLKVPASTFVGLLNNVPGGLLNVLQAKAGRT